MEDKFQNIQLELKVKHTPPPCKQPLLLFAETSHNEYLLL